MLIRAERPEDAVQIGRIHTLAFGHDDEQKLIDRLRQDEAFDPQLSLVAEQDGQVIGHVLFSPVTVESPAASVPAMILAPLAVLEEYRGAGAGTALVTEGLARLRQRGVRLVLVWGGEFYSRFGFVPAHPYGIFRPNPMPGHVVRLLELTPGAAEGVMGVIRYPAAFGPMVNQWYPGA